jgi:hypothetical protein
VFPSLNLASAFAVDESDVPESRRLRSADSNEEGRPENCDTETTFPNRSLPLVQPARDTGSTNEPDLEARKNNGQLSIYYPDRTDARITSDTWKDVER